MWIFGRKGPSGFSACSTAEEVAQGIDGNGLTAVVTGLFLIWVSLRFLFPSFVRLVWLLRKKRIHTQFGCLSVTGGYIVHFRFLLGLRIELFVLIANCNLYFGS